MAIIFGILVFIFVIVCVLLCLLVLIQSDKGGGISGAIGGGLGGANSLLGTQDTANILTRGTAIFGGIFLVLCIAMSAVVGRQNETQQKSILQDRAKKQQSFSPSSILNGNSMPVQNSAQPPITGQPQSAAPAAGQQSVPQGAAQQGALPVVPNGGQQK